jgi:hypothetical protein
MENHHSQNWKRNSAIDVLVQNLFAHSGEQTQDLFIVIFKHSTADPQWLNFCYDSLLLLFHFNKLIYSHKA